VWASQAEFEAWTNSDAFRKAHQGAKPRAGLYLGPPRFEGFDVLQKVQGDGA
jgi:heme-degrading monooxygenase HmoA